VIEDAEVGLGEVRGEVTVRLPEDHAPWLRCSAANSAFRAHDCPTWVDSQSLYKIKPS
jgi:hypothetical protein